MNHPPGPRIGQDVCVLPTSTGESPACIPIIRTSRPIRQLPSIDDWRSYGRAKRRLAATHRYGTEEYDDALARYCKEHGL